jgi:hypothetical protein
MPPTGPTLLPHLPLLFFVQDIMAAAAQNAQAVQAALAAVRAQDLADLIACLNVCDVTTANHVNGIR